MAAVEAHTALVTTELLPVGGFTPEEDVVVHGLLTGGPPVRLDVQEAPSVPVTVQTDVDSTVVEGVAFVVRAVFTLRGGATGDGDTTLKTVPPCETIQTSVDNTVVGLVVVTALLGVVCEAVGTRLVPPGHTLQGQGVHDLLPRYTVVPVPLVLPRF